MTYSKKLIFLVGLLTPVLFYAINVVIIRSFIEKRQNSSNSDVKMRAGLTKAKGEERIVISYSNQRSGSTFMGEIFNRNKDVFYLYEPLFPFTPHCKVLNKERLDVLERMLRCNFFNNQQAFNGAQAVTRFRDSPSRCISNSVCFVSQSQSLIHSYQQFCEKIYDPRYCNFPSRPDVLSRMCSSSRIIAYKVLRVCSLKDVDVLYQKLSKEGKDLFVVHLVRDPRAIISSKLKLELKKKDVAARTEELCLRLRKNLEFVDNTTDIARMVKDRRYMRIRYEDAATDPINAAVSVYRFLGLSLSDEVRNWINTSTILPRQHLHDIQEKLKTGEKNQRVLSAQYVTLTKQLKDPYGTVKDPSSTIQKWRGHLPLETVLNIQEICSSVLERLKYTLVKNAHDLTDWNKPLWQ